MVTYRKASLSAHPEGASGAESSSAAPDLRTIGDGNQNLNILMSANTIETTLSTNLAGARLRGVQSQRDPQRTQPNYSTLSSVSRTLLERRMRERSPEQMEEYLDRVRTRYAQHEQEHALAKQIVAQKRLAAAAARNVPYSPRQDTDFWQSWDSYAQVCDKMLHDAYLTEVRLKTRVEQYGKRKWDALRYSSGVSGTLVPSAARESFTTMSPDDREHLRRTQELARRDVTKRVELQKMAAVSILSSPGAAAFAAATAVATAQSPVPSALPTYRTVRSISMQQPRKNAVPRLYLPARY